MAKKPASPPRRVGPSASVSRELGRLTEAVERSHQDREELRVDVKDALTGISDLGSRLSNLEQSAKSSNDSLMKIATERVGERMNRADSVLFPPPPEKALHLRVEELERTVSAWRRWLGSGKSFFLRLFFVLIGLSAFWEAVHAWWERIVGGAPPQ